MWSFWLMNTLCSLTNIGSAPGSSVALICSALFPGLPGYWRVLPLRRRAAVDRLQMTDWPPLAHRTPLHRREQCVHIQRRQWRVQCNRGLDTGTGDSLPEDFHRLGDMRCAQIEGVANGRLIGIARADKPYRPACRWMQARPGCRLGERTRVGNEQKHQPGGVVLLLQRGMQRDRVGRELSNQVVQIVILGLVLSQPGKDIGKRDL